MKPWMGAFIRTLASRIETYTVGGQVLISESTCAEVGEQLRTRRSFKVLPKGAREALTIYDVVGITGAHELTLPEATSKLRRLAAGAPARFTVLEGKDASLESMPATLLAHGGKSPAPGS